MDIKLVKPTLEYSRDIMSYKEEFLQCGDTMAGCSNLRECYTANEWIETINIREREETCSPDKVPSNTYLAVRTSDNRIVGIIDFRHHINHPILSVWGGHMGYSVRPSERKKGYATEMLRQNILKCKAYGLDKILITCDDDNIASKKVIVSNGGIFEKSVKVDDDIVERYWITL